MNKKVVVFGASGGIGSAVVNCLTQQKYDVVVCNQQHINFCDKNSDQLVADFLDREQADIVINSVGIFGSNTQSHHDIMDVNFGSNWTLIKYFMNAQPQHPVKLIMIGSVAYKQGRSWAMVYSASKAAVYNLWESARDYFQDSQLTVNIVNPQRTKTNMTAQRYREDLQYLDSDYVAEQILKLIQSDRGHSCVDIEFDSVIYR